MWYVHTQEQRLYEVIIRNYCTYCNIDGHAIDYVTVILRNIKNECTVTRRSTEKSTDKRKKNIIRQGKKKRKLY